MRTVIALAALLSLAVACGGEVAPDSSDKSAASQAASQEPAQDDPPVGAATPGHGSGYPTSSPCNAIGCGSSGAIDAGPAATACFLGDGPSAPGECNVGDERACPSDVDAGRPSEGPAGFCRQRCVNLDGTARWSEPTTSAECAYYDTNLFIGGNNPACACNTPLVLSFDNESVVFGTDATGSFDLTRLGVSHGSDWPTATTPWLALDRDGNGTIDDGGELFGSATRLATGAFATNGFDALRDLDDNHDGVFDGKDVAFAHVVVWSDRNRDRKSTPNELTSLASRGVTSISLADHRDTRCDGRGNCEGERASFTFGSGRRGTVIDVYLPTR